MVCTKNRGLEGIDFNGHCLEIACSQVFSDVSISFSIGGKHYTGDPIVYNTIEDKIFEYSRNVTIKLHHRIGKFVKLRFGFAARWIMISEITFDSGEFYVTVFYICTMCVSVHTYMYALSRERGESPHIRVALQWIFFSRFSVAC